MKTMTSLALTYTDGVLQVLDQQKLPQVEEWLLVKSPEEMSGIIKALKIRGAPLIGVAAAVCLADFALRTNMPDKILSAAHLLREARPTAINLMICIDRMLANYEKSQFATSSLVATAEEIFSEDVELCSRMAEAGASLVVQGERILTHCNTGSLATAGVGTALGVIQKAHQQNKNIHVYVDETRPLLQGGRLTTWELKKLNIPHTLICDNMAAHLMSQGQVSKIFVGSDRIAVNGDFANKIGTYSLAVNAFYHRIPFYVVAPYTTVDSKCLSGGDIPIEQRHANEVRGVSGSFGQILWSPTEVNVYNPAFDVTPAELVTGWVLDTGIYNLSDVKNGVFKSN